MIKYFQAIVVQKELTSTIWLGSIFTWKFKVTCSKTTRISQSIPKITMKKIDLDEQSNHESDPTKIIIFVHVVE